MKIPRKFLESADRAGVAGTDGAAYAHIRGLGGVSYDARAGAAAQHRQIVVEEMLAGDGGSRVTFDDVVGLENGKRSLNEAVVLPLVAPKFFSGARKPWNGVLLFGPPGSGKTLLAKAVAGVHGVRFFDCSASALLNKFWGESEKIARTLFAVGRAPGRGRRPRGAPAAPPGLLPHDGHGRVEGFEEGADDADGPPREARGRRRRAARGEQGRTRERNSQLQRLRSRPFSTRFG
jgi:hypothetical protein